VTIKFPDDMVALSFAIANALPIENLEKQRLLELTDTLERLASLIPMLDAQIIEAQAGPSMTKIHPQDLQEWVFKN
jgi:Lon protease-like protein